MQCSKNSGHDWPGPKGKGGGVGLEGGGRDTVLYFPLCMVFPSFRHFLLKLCFSSFSC